MTLIEECVFCRIVRGIIPCRKLLETDKIMAFLDAHPLSPGHTLVIPKFHGERLHVIPDEYLADMLLAAKRIAQKAFAQQGIDYNILQNNGRLAHQDVNHLHMHIIPKPSACVGLELNWNPINMTQEEMETICQKMSLSLSE